MSEERDGDELVVTLLGSGGATPYAGRINPSVLLQTQDHTILCDVGAGVSLRLSEAGVDPAKIDAICFTHFHADHCVEFPLLLLAIFLEGRETPLAIVGPPGTEKTTSLLVEQLFPYVPELINAITGTSHLYEIEETEGGEVGFSKDRCRVACASVQHGVPALGFSCVTPSGKVAISGDTEPCESLVALATGADLLVQECPFPPEMGQTPGHTTPFDVGRVAAEAGVEQVVLTHLFAETKGHEDAILAEIAKTYDGSCVVGQDLMRFAI